MKNILAAVTLACLASHHVNASSEEELVAERNREHLRNSELPLLYDTNKKADPHERPLDIYELCPQPCPEGYPILNPP